MKSLRTHIDLLPRQFVFSQPMLFMPDSYRWNFDGFLLSMYTHHFFIKWAPENAPEIRNFLKKFYETKSVPENEKDEKKKFLMGT